VGVFLLILHLFVNLLLLLLLLMELNKKP